MSKQKPEVLHRFGLALGVSVCLLFACARVLDASEPAPQVSKDGLQLQKQTKQRLVYLKPGASFSQYVAEHEPRFSGQRSPAVQAPDLILARREVQPECAR